MLLANGSEGAVTSLLSVLKMLMDSSSSIRLAGRPGCFSLLEPNAFLDVILLRGSFCKHNLEPERLLLRSFFESNLSVKTNIKGVNSKYRL